MITTESELDHFMMDVPSYNTIFYRNNFMKHLLSEMCNMNTYNDPVYYKMVVYNGETDTTEDIYNLTCDDGCKRRETCISVGEWGMRQLYDLLSLGSSTSVKFYVRDDKYAVVYNKSYSSISDMWRTRLEFNNNCDFRKLHHNITLCRLLEILTKILKVEREAIRENNANNHGYDLRTMKTKLKSCKQIASLLVEEPSSVELGENLIQPKLTADDVDDVLTNKTRIHCYNNDMLVGVYQIVKNPKTKLYDICNLNII